jgi:hypothetical protein
MRVRPRATGRNRAGLEYDMILMRLGIDSDPSPMRLGIESDRWRAAERISYRNAGYH